MQNIPPKNDKSKSFMIKRKNQSKMMNRFSQLKRSKENENQFNNKSKN
jgi:hypothetical protein